MTLDKALRYRTILKALVKPLEKDEVEIAVYHYKYSNQTDDYEVHLFSRKDSSSAYCKLAALALAIEQIELNILTIPSEYDYGTTESKKVKSWKLF